MVRLECLIPRMFGIAFIGTVLCSSTMSLLPRIGVFVNLLVAKVPDIFGHGLSTSVRAEKGKHCSGLLGKGCVG